MRPRALISRSMLTVALVCALVGGVATAAIFAERDAPVPQISLNVELPVFQVVGLVPGDAMTRCVRVRNEGDETIALQDGIAVTGDLAQYLRVAVERGSGLGDVGPSCSGFTSTGTYGYGTTAAGVAPSALRPDVIKSWAGHAEKSLRVTVSLPAGTPNAAMTKTGTVTLAFAGYPLSATTTPTTPTTTPTLPGGVAPGTDGGYDKHGNFLTNSQIKKRLRIGKARLLRNGDVVVKMFLPAGGAIRAKAILPNGVYYAHTLLPVEWGPTVRVVLKRRPVGRAEVLKRRKQHRELVVRVTTRYRWAHGPNAFVQPEQRLRILRGAK